MGKEKRIELIKEIRHPLSILVIIPSFIGFLIFFTGFVLPSSINVLSHLGIGLMLYGLFVIRVVGLIKGEEKPFKSIVMILIGVSFLITYIYLYNVLFLAN